MTAAHSILPPSGAAAWRQCAMWVTMNQKYPQPDTPESLEGTAAHEVVVKRLAGQPVNEGELATNGTAITAEMIDGADLAVDVVRERIPADVSIYVEKSVNIPRVHSQCFGTPDIWAFDETGMTLEIIDYKFGHRFVDEYENDQLIAYAAGILDYVGVALEKAPGILDQAVLINFTIIQPRCFYKGSPVRTWSVRASDLRAHINRLANAAGVALAPDPAAVTNDECRYCPGRHACPALQQAAYADAEFAVRSSPVELSPADASLELRMLEHALTRLQSRVEGMREAVSAHIRAGHATPWHRAEQGYGRSQWTVPVEQVVALGDLMGVNLSKPGVITPTQAKKAGIDEAVIKAYSVTPMGAIKLIPVNPADARRVFGSTK